MPLLVGDQFQANAGGWSRFRQRRRRAALFKPASEKAMSGVSRFGFQTEVAQRFGEQRRIQAFDVLHARHAVERFQAIQPLLDDICRKPRPYCGAA